MNQFRHLLKVFIKAERIEYLGADLSRFDNSIVFEDFQVMGNCGPRKLRFRAQIGHVDALFLAYLSFCDVEDKLLPDLITKGDEEGATGIEEQLYPVPIRFIYYRKKSSFHIYPQTQLHRYIVSIMIYNYPHIVKTFNYLNI